MKYLPGFVVPVLGHQFLPLVTELMKQTNFSLDVLQYNWTWKRWERNNRVSQFTSEVIAAARRGVTCRILLNAESQNHVITRANQRTAQKLGAAGCQAKLTRTTPCLHSKMFIVDSEWVVLGSHNMTGRSLLANDETSVIIRSKEVVKFYKDYFNIIWQRS